MRRNSINDPKDFPWKFFFTDSEEDYNKARTFCSSKQTGSLDVKRAVTVIGGGDQLGTKEENCEKIIARAKIINKQIKMVPSSQREEKRNELIEHYRSALINKQRPEESIYPKPELPYLQEAEIKPRGKKKADIVDESEEKQYSLDDIYISEAIVFYRKNFGEKIKTSDFKEYMINKYPDIDSDLPKQLIRKVFEDNKKLNVSINDYKNAMAVLKYASSFRKALSSGAAKKKVLVEEEMQQETESVEPVKIKRRVVVEEPEVAESEPVKIKRRVVIEEPEVVEPEPVKIKRRVVIEEPEVVEPEPVKIKRRVVIEEPEVVEPEPVKIKRKVLSEEEEPIVEIETVPAKEFITLDEIKDFISEKGWKPMTTDSKEELFGYVIKNIARDFRRLSVEKETQIQAYEDLKRRLEILSEHYDSKQIDAEECSRKVIELEKTIVELENKILSLKNIIQEAERIKEEEAEFSGMCFQIKDWMNEEKFDLKIAEHDLSCPSGSVCDLDKGKCVKKYVKKPVDILNKKIIGSIDDIENIVSKVEKRIKDIEAEKEKIKATISSIEAGEIQTAKQVTLQPVAEELRVKSLPPVRKEVSQVFKTCAMKDEYDSVEEISQDLECGGDKVCDLNSKICVDSDRFTEVQIGGKVIKVSGKEELIEKIKDRIEGLIKPIIKETPVAVQEEVVEEVRPSLKKDGVELEEETELLEQVIPAKTTDLESIVKTLKNVLSDRPVTTAQNKIKKVSKIAMDKIAKCAGF
jgi:hypothetical protein